MCLAYAAAKTQTSKKEKVGAQKERAVPVGLYLGQTTGEYVFWHDGQGTQIEQRQMEGE